MTYIALVQGRGEGCDYTIRCNRDFIVFDAIDDGAALNKCRDHWDYHGGEPIEAVRLFLAGAEIPVPVATWNQAQAEERQATADAKALSAAEAVAAELRAKIARKAAP